MRNQNAIVSVSSHAEKFNNMISNDHGRMQKYESPVLDVLEFSFLECFVFYFRQLKRNWPRFSLKKFCRRQHLRHQHCKIQ